MIEVQSLARQHPLANPNHPSNRNLDDVPRYNPNFSPTNSYNLKPSFLPNMDNDFARESIIQLAEAFLGTPKRRKPPSNAAFAAKQVQLNGKDTTNMDPFLTIRQLAPGADKNFGIPKGEGIPFNLN